MLDVMCFCDVTFAFSMSFKLMPHWLFSLILCLIIEGKGEYLYGKKIYPC